MIMKNWFLLSIFLFASNASAQEKKPLDHQALDTWNQMHAHALAPNGQWVFLSVGPDQKDTELRIKSLTEEQVYILPRAESTTFTADAKHVVTRIKAFKDSVQQAKQDKKKPEETPGDSLAVLTLSSGEEIRFGRIKSYKIPEDAGGWVAYLLEKVVEKEDTTDVKKEELPESETETKESSEIKESPESEESPESKESEESPETKESEESPEKKLEQKPPPKSIEPPEPEQKSEDEKSPVKKKIKSREKSEGTELVLRNLNTGSETRYPHVLDYHFSKNGNWLVFTAASKDSTADGIYAVQTTTGDSLSLLTGPGDYKRIAIDDAGKQIAFLANRDSFLADSPVYSLYYWRTGSPSAKPIATKKYLAANWWPSEHGGVSFSENGKRLLFHTAPAPEPEYEDDTPDDKKVSVDIWHYQDTRLQSMQLKQAKEDRNRNYLVVAHLKSGRVIQLATEAIPDVTIGNENNANIALGINEEPYLRSIVWNTRPDRDIYLIDVRTGKKRPIATKSPIRSNLSPNSKYLFWWDRTEKAWFTQNVNGGTPINITQKITTPVYNELHDKPNGFDHHGEAGWTADDKAFLIYDRYDIWSLDPAGKRPPKNLTRGRQDSLRFRYIRLDPDEKAIDLQTPLLLSAFNHVTKAHGYFRLPVKDKQTPLKLWMTDHKLYDLKKAKNAPVLTFRRSRFEEYPNLWVSDPDFQSKRQISNVNPQQKEYLWGSAEQVSWTSLDGTPLRGILCKPEGFDPTHKYPLIVFFYERLSERLHDHWATRWAYSTISIPYYVSQGYLLFLPDIAYKIGYPGESAFNAVMSGVQHLVDKGFVDEHNLGLQSHSWGGYQIAYILTRTNRFKAAQAGAVVANMVSAYGTVRHDSEGESRMWLYENDQSRIGGTLWDYPLRYIENSPIFQADKIHTPLLMMHNDKDPWVPWHLGMELFMALYRLNRPVWLVNYNGERHWPIKLAHRKDWTIRMEQFFNHYLKGAPAPTWLKQGIPALQKGKTLGLELE